jgi:hypothetical protein
VARNGAETSDQGYFKTTFADNTRKTAILNVCLFKFLSTRTTTVLEGIKVAQFSKKCASCNNGKPNPKTPNDAAKNGNDFVTE